MDDVNRDTRKYDKISSEAHDALASDYAYNTITTRSLHAVEKLISAYHQHRDMYINEGERVEALAKERDALKKENDANIMHFNNFTQELNDICAKYVPRLPHPILSPHAIPQPKPDGARLNKPQDTEGRTPLPYTFQPEPSTDGLTASAGELEDRLKDARAHSLHPQHPQHSSSSSTWPHNNWGGDLPPLTPAPKAEGPTLQDCLTEDVQRAIEAEIAARFELARVRKERDELRDELNKMSSRERKRDSAEWESLSQAYRRQQKE